MLYKLLCFILAWFTTVSVSGQTTAPAEVASTTKAATTSISGYVTDAASGEALVGAVVVVRGQSGLSTTTNTYGFYSLRLPAGPTTLQVRYVGYSSLEIALPAGQTTPVLQLRLQPLPNELATVEVIASKATDLEQVNRLSIRGAELKQLPRLMGETDAVKALQLMPGIQAGREGSSDLIVRGGSPEQNLVLLDGVPVYNVAHLLGLFSVFNPDAIKTVDVLKGGFPAQYGGRLSSVIDIQLKEGNNQQFAGEGAIGLISSKILVEGPVKNEKTSYLLAARRTYLDALTSAATAITGEPISKYNFYDINAKINHTFSAKDRVYASFYGGQDTFSDKNTFQDSLANEQQKFAMRWGNTTTSLRWNHVFTSRLFSNLTLIHSRYAFAQQSTVRQVSGDSSAVRTSDYTSKIRDWGAKMDFDYFLTARHAVRFGATYYRHDFTPEAVTLTADTLRLTSNSFPRTKAHEFYGYAEDRLTLSERLRANVGLHFSGFVVNGKFYSSLQPRIILNYLVAPTLGLRASYATMTQYLHLLSNTSTGTPTDIWVPATDKLRPQRSWQATLGAAKTIGSNWEITADAYYKALQDVVEFKDGADFIADFFRRGPQTNFASFVAPSYETRIVRGRGWSYGTEWLLRKRRGKTTGWVGYTLAWAWRQLDSVNAGQKYPYTYDSRHSVSLVANHQLTPHLSIGGSFTFRTGFVTTLPATRYKAYNEPVEQPGTTTSHVESVDYIEQRNNYRMPAYHRLDISLTHTKKKRWGERSWNLSVYNAYNHKNPYFLYLSSPVAGTTTNYGRRLYQVSLFPVLPSISYGFKF